MHSIISNRVYIGHDIFFFNLLNLRCSKRKSDVTFNLLEISSRVSFVPLSKIHMIPLMLWSSNGLNKFPKFKDYKHQVMYHPV